MKFGGFTLSLRDANGVQREFKIKDYTLPTIEPEPRNVGTRAARHESLRDLSGVIERIAVSFGDQMMAFRARRLERNLRRDASRRYGCL